MKKVLSLIIAFALLVSLPMLAFADGEHSPLLVDEAGLLTESEFDSLNKKLESLRSELDFDIVVLTVTSYDGKTDMDFADDYYDYNGYAYDGCILVYNPNEGENGLYVSTSGFGITAVTDYCLKYLSKNVKPVVLDGQYYEGFNIFADSIEDFVKQARAGEAYDIDNNIEGFNPNERTAGEKVKTAAVCVIAAVVISLIVSFGISRSYTKAVKFSRDASNYLVPGSLKMSNSYDNYLYSNVTKVKIQTESSSGGSSTHTSSSGSSHGGGRL